MRRYGNQIRDKLITSAPGKQLIRTSQRIFIPGSERYSLFELWGPFMAQLKRANLLERASAISFNIVMAIPPTLIFVFTLIPYLPISNRFISELFVLIRDIVPGEKDHAVIIQFLDDFLNQPRNELLSFGLFLALFFSSNAMMGVLRSFSKNYEGFLKRKGLQQRKMALLLTLMVFMLVMVCLLLLIAHAAVLEWLGVETVWLRNLIHNFRWAIIALIIFFIVSFVYRHGAALATKWPFFTPGSVFATTLMGLFTFGVTFYVEHFANYNKVYGSIGAIFILMSLIYANALALIMGFELNVTLVNLNRKREKEKAAAENPTSG